MKRLLIIGLLPLLLLSVPFPQDVELYNNGQIHQEEPVVQYVPGELILKVRRNVAFNSGAPAKHDLSGDLMLKYKRQIRGLEFHPATGYYIARVDEGQDLQQVKQVLEADLAVEAVSLNYIATLAETIPNDPYFEGQWGLRNTGQVYRPVPMREGTPGADIKVTDAWDWTVGDQSAIIAVIDTGVDFDHEDLKNKIVPGYDFVNDRVEARDDHGHGTLVASIAAAETGNEIGIAGVAPNAMIMPIKAVDKWGGASYLTIAAGMRFAADHGATVINLSLGGSYSTFVLEDASRYAFEKGCVLVCAAGNHASPVIFPAAYDEYSLAVTASDPDDEIPSWCSYGPEVDVAAPGVDVMGAYYSRYQPDVHDKYTYGNGTSFATPIVAGAVALLQSYKPFITNSQAMDLIRATADDVNYAKFPGFDAQAGYGRLNMKTLISPYVLD
jgi:subtilisin family serine protease